MKQRLKPSWDRLTLLQKTRFFLELELICAGISIGEWTVKQGRRGLLMVLATVAYVLFFTLMAKRINPEFLFVAGFVLGAVLVGLWLIVIFVTPKK